MFLLAGANFGIARKADPEVPLSKLSFTELRQLAGLSVEAAARELGYFQRTAYFP